MSRLLPIALLLASTAPALTDTIAAASRVTAVTLYPMGAEVTREVTFTAPPGAHDLVIPDLPGQTDPGFLRLASPDTGLGAFALRTDRMTPTDLPEPPALTQAKAKVESAQAALTETLSARAAITARIEAQKARIALLAGLQLDGAGQTAESLTAISDMVAAKVLQSHEAIIEAEALLPAVEARVTTAQEALDQARAALEALAQSATDRATLSVAITAKGGEGRLTIRHFAEGGWRPVYDLHLDRKAQSLQLDRGLLVTQVSGEDWQDVALTLSTAQPGQQAEASSLWPDLRRLADPQPMARAEIGSAMGEALAAPTMIQSAQPLVEGDTVTYAYPTPVSLASGVEDLRLALDSQNLAAKTLALAVPRHDQTAFLQAALTNSGTEILLPGQANLYRDGMLTGSTTLPLLAPGDTAKLGFGAIPGLKLTRDMPERSQGDRGVFATSTERRETATLRIENLTDETWPLRVLDQVPYSEEEELRISHSASPAPSEENVEGQRGILAWDFDLAPGKTQEITLDTTIAWPEGKDLQ